MTDYTFWTGLFDTWKATSDWIKALMILTPPGFALGAMTLLLRHRAETKASGLAPPVAQPSPRLPDDIDQFLSGEDNDMQNRQQAARQALLLEPPAPESAEILEDIRRIILENYRANHPPEEALRRVRHFLTDRPAQHNRPK